MKKIIEKFMALAGIIFIMPAISFTQDVKIPEASKPYMHKEVPGDPYLPNAFGNKKTTPGRIYRGTGIFTTQVNVNQNGENIVGDAANEPSIGVNPLNPDQMVIGWRQFDNVNSNFRQAGYAYTTDAGQTWTFMGTIETGIFRSDPVLDFDSSGYAYYNSLSSDGSSYYTKVFKSDDGGGTWNAGVPAQGGDKQWMTIDRRGEPEGGNIYSFWTSYYSWCYPGFFTRSIDAGESFEWCTEIPGNPYWGTMAVGNDGELYIGAASQNGGIVVCKSTTAWNTVAPVSWDFNTDVDVDGYLTSQVAVNPAGLLGQVCTGVDHSDGPGRGNVYVLSSVVRYSNSDPADVMFSKSTDGGLTFSAPVRINDDEGTSRYQWFGTMSVAPNGRIDVVWLDTRDAFPGGVNSALYYSYSTDQGETWSTNERLSELFNPHDGWPQQNKMGDYFDMKSDEDGARLAWANTLNGEQDVYYSYITPDFTGLDDQKDKNQISMSCYPNPFSDHVTISYGIKTPGRVRIEIIDLYGKVVKSLLDETEQAGNHHIAWDSGLPAGYYTCRVTSDGRSKSISLLKVR